MEIFQNFKCRLTVILKCRRLQIWGIGSTCGSLSAVKLSYYLQGLKQIYLQFCLHFYSAYSVLTIYKCCPKRLKTIKQDIWFFHSITE